MVHIYPGAKWMPIDKNYTPRRRSRTDLLVNHVAGGEARSLHPWFMNPRARASSHLYILRKGRPEQYVDLDMVAWGNGAANSRSIIVETQGGAAGEWNDHQVRELIKFWVYIHRHYGVPLRAVTTSKSYERGIAHHRLGVPATYAQKRRGVSQTGGELWSSAVGKVCPGPDRIRQIPGMVAQAQKQAARKAPGKAPAPKPAKPTITTPAIEEILKMAKATHIQFSHKGKVYIANLLAGTYYHVPGPTALKQHRATLQRTGMKFEYWGRIAGQKNDEADPRAFGVEIKA